MVEAKIYSEIIKLKFWVGRWTFLFHRAEFSKNASIGDASRLVSESNLWCEVLAQKLLLLTRSSFEGKARCLFRSNPDKMRQPQNGLYLQNRPDLLYAPGAYLTVKPFISEIAYCMVPTHWLIMATFLCVPESPEQRVMRVAVQ